MPVRDRKSTRLNSSHLVISYAVFCLKKKKTKRKEKDINRPTAVTTEVRPHVSVHARCYTVVRLFSYAGFFLFSLFFFFFFFLIIRRPPRSPLFPYTPLFR